LTLAAANINHDLTGCGHGIRHFAEFQNFRPAVPFDEGCFHWHSSLFDGNTIAFLTDAFKFDLRSNRWGKATEQMRWSMHERPLLARSGQNRSRFNSARRRV
jgi:hypothetical protein